MKKVGIIIRKLDIDEYDIIGTRLDLFETFNKFDVVTIGIPIINDFDKIRESVDLCDGIVLSGGFYNSQNDYELIKYLYEKNIPTLGICLGMQSMAMTFNNKQETKIKNHNSLNNYVHDININKNSLLYKIIGKEKISVNSRHNYAIPTTNFKVNAISEDNIIEGIEDPNKKFFLGVQWHPESTADINSYKLLKYFIDNI